MRKTVQFLMLSLFICSPLARAEQKFTVVGQKVNGTAMSPDGNYVVGIDPLPVQYGNSNAYGGFRSYLWDAQTGMTTWMTELDLDDLAKSGYFTDVNNDKTIVGYFKNPDYQISVADWEGTETLPVNVAAVWKDGTRTSLGIGDFKLTDFSNFADGSYATTVSSDGKTVAGFVACGNFATSTPCVWNYNESTSKWDFSRFKLPSGAKGGQVLSVSGDGRVAVGMVAYQNRTVSAFWKSTGECTLIEGRKDGLNDDTKYNEDYNNGCAYKISPNGEYIAFAFNDEMPGMFFTNEDRYIKIGTYNGVTALEITAVSDNGDVVGNYKYGNYWTEQYTRPFWYSLNTLRNVDFSYFIYLYAPEIEIPYSFIFEDKITSTLRAVTADGKTIMGNNGTDNWVLQTDAAYAMIPENVEGLKTKITDLKEVTVLWKAVTFAPFGNLLKSYNVYCDGKLIGNVPAEEIGGGEGGGGIEPLSEAPGMVSFVHREVAAGYRKYSVTAMYENKESGKALETPKCDPVEICVAKNFDLPLTDDFDSGSIELNYWTVDNWSENPDKIFWGCGMYLGIGSSFALNSTVATEGKPYSSAFVSRPMDARNLDHVYVSYVKRYLFANSEDWPLDADSLSIEVTVDGGDTWTPVKHHLIADEVAGSWSFESIDLTPYVAHRLFQLRLREHGKGSAQLVWYFDLFKVATLAENEAPEDLTGRVEEDGVKLMWKNSIGAYELNYLDSPYGWNVYALAIGDEGNPFIAASSFDPADLELYRGKYITSIRAFINHDTGIENSKETHASVVIYENGQLVREQEITPVEQNEENLVFLDEPIAIDPSKELKVGIKIFDYDERQIPLAYQNTRNFIAGKSDLYSQDNGQTWQKLSDFYADVKDHEYDGYCCWEITANITDEATVSKDARPDENLMAYNIYRNGEKLNDQLIYCLQPRFTDKTPEDNACYEVVAYYFDGSMSESSAQYCIEKTAIENASSEEDLLVYPNPASDRIHIAGAFDKATLLNVNGQPVVETTQNTLTVSQLLSGVYFLRIQSGEQVTTRKIMIR